MGGVLLPGISEYIPSETILQFLIVFLTVFRVLFKTECSVEPGYRSLIEKCLNI